MTRTTSRGRDQITEEAADAAIEQARRILRLPTIRDRFGDQAAAAARQQATYKSFAGSPAEGPPPGSNDAPSPPQVDLLKHAPSPEREDYLRT